MKKRWLTVLLALLLFMCGVQMTVSAGTSVSKILVSQKPTKTVYTVGDTLNTAGMKLKVTCSDGTSKEISSGFTCSPTNLTAAGNTWITVKYGGTATAFNVKVGKKIKSVTITKKPTKLTYTVGDTFNASGMKLKVTYTDNTTAEVTSGWTCTPTKLNTAGQQKITVKYGTGATGFYVTVSETSNLPKLTNSNAAQVLKKQLWWFAGFMNCFAGNFYEDDYFYDSDNDYIYYRSRDCNNKADYVKLMRNYLIISDEYINLVFDFKEVKVMSGKNHLLIFLLCLTIILTGLSIVSAADLNSTEVDDSGDVIVSIDEEALSDNTKTFKDLNHDINDNTKSKIYFFRFACNMSYYVIIIMQCNNISRSII